jgi:hypothetical protein
VEPFYLRCETCQARLRVRDEQFLGQVQSCPKCGSMVLIAAPAGWLAAEQTAEVADTAAIEAAAAPTLAARAVPLVREHLLAWSIGAGAAVALGGAVLVFALSGEAEHSPPSATMVAVAEQATQGAEESPAETPAVADIQSEEEVQEELVDAEPVAEPPSSDVTQAELPASAPPLAQVVEPAQPPTPPAAPQTVTRTLKLVPVTDEPRVKIAAPPPEAKSDYSPAVEVDAAVAAAASKPQAAAPPARVTNMMDQLAVPIESIDLPAMPIGEFINLMSGMAAVPIKLDPKVLGDVGLSSRSTVTVRGDNTTVGKLLAGMLKEYQLTCVERDGVLVVVKAKR